MYCANCGREATDGAVHCEYCGFKLSDGLADHKIGTEEDVVIVNSSGIVTSKPDVNKNSGRRGGRLLATIVLIALLVITLILVFLVFGSTGASNADAKIMESMRVANGGVLPDLLYDGDDLVSIEGTFSSTRVLSDTDALSAVSEVAPLFGIYRPNVELELKREERDDAAGVVAFVFAIKNENMVGSDRVNDDGDNKLPQENDAKNQSEVDIIESVEGSDDLAQQELIVTAREDGTVLHAEKRAAEIESELELASKSTDSTSMAEKTVPLVTSIRYEIEGQPDAEDGLSQAGYTLTYDYEYDDKARITRKTIGAETTVGTDALEFSEANYVYDKQGRLSHVEKVGNYDSYSWDISYSEDNRSMSAEGTLSDQSLWTPGNPSGMDYDASVQDTYDDDGKLVRRYCSFPKLISYINYSYNNDGQLEKITVDVPIGDERQPAYTYEANMSYDDEDRLVKIDGDGFILSGDESGGGGPTVISYAYDEDGNLISRHIESDADQIPVSYEIDQSYTYIDGMISSAVSQTVHNDLSFDHSFDVQYSSQNRYQEAQFSHDDSGDKRITTYTVKGRTGESSYSYRCLYETTTITLQDNDEIPMPVDDATLPFDRFIDEIWAGKLPPNTESYIFQANKVWLRTKELHGTTAG